MNDKMIDQFSAADVQARGDFICGRPPRIPPLPPEERSARQNELLAAMGMITVDGVYKPRADLAALEILIRHAELYKIHTDVAQVLLTDGTLGIRDRELAILRLAWLSQAPFEWGAHVKIAKRNGVRSEEVEWAIEGSSAAGWSKRDSTTLRAMEELHFDSMIADATWADLRGGYEDKQMIELIILAGQYKTVAYYQNSLRLPLPEGNLGLMAR